MMLSVIMPMYNSGSIAKDLQEACEILDSAVRDYEIILVDDGSTSRCLEEAQSFKNKKVRIVGYRKNQGKGFAIKYGFKFAKGDYIAFLDSGRDLSPRLVSDFLREINSRKADVVIGSKRHPDSIVEYPLARRFMSRVYQLANRVLFNLKVKDTQVGVKLFRREVLDKVMPRVLVKRFAFDLELLAVVNKFGFKIVEAPIVLKYRFQSTINLKSVFWMLVDTAAIFYRLKIRRYYG